MQVYLVSVKTPALRYQVLRFDEETKTATLKKDVNYPVVEFEIRPFTKAHVEAQGYKLVRE